MCCYLCFSKIHKIENLEIRTVYTGILLSFGGYLMFRQFLYFNLSPNCTENENENKNPTV